jgi:hypothetical protein
VVKGNQSFISAQGGDGEEKFCDWCLNIDLRGASGLSPVDGQLPSTFIEVSWSSDLDYDE